MRIILVLWYYTYDSWHPGPQQQQQQNMTFFRYMIVRELKEKANSNSYDPDEEAKDAEGQAAKGKLKGTIRNFVQ